MEIDTYRDMQHARANNRIESADPMLVVFTPAAMVDQPGECAFQPSARQWPEMLVSPATAS
jgi:hypothetical protein